MSLPLRSSSRLSILDLSSAYTDAARDSRSSTTAPGKTLDDDEHPKKGPRSRSRDMNQKQKVSSASGSSSQHRSGRKRKNCTDVEERRKQLEADPWTLEVRSRIVKCLGCKRWIKLDQRNEYYSGLWAKHRDLCRGVKMMKGEALPKRTRRSKKKTSVPANTDSGSDTPPVSEPAPEISPVPTDDHLTPAPIEPIIQSAPPPRRHSHRAQSDARDCTPVSVSVSASRASPAAMPLYHPYHPPPPKPASPGYPWGQYVPYYGAPYVAYYPVPPPLSLKLPPLSSVVRHRSPSPGLVEEHDVDEDDDMDDDAERYAFAPPSHNEVCRGHGCRPRFRYSTRREIRTYFDGATLDSMAQNLSCPADDVTYRGAACLLSLKRKLNE